MPSDKAEPVMNSSAARGLRRSGNPAYTSDRRLYLDKDGKVVEADSPDRLTLLVGENGTLTHARAVELGLVKEDGDDARAIKPEAVENKGVDKAAHTPAPAPREGAGLSTAPAAGKPVAGQAEATKAKG